MNAHSPIGLTRRQKKLLEFVRAYNAEHQMMPTFEEMMAGLGIKSKSGIHRLLTALESRGHVQRDRYHARALSLVQHCCPHCGGAL